MITCNGRLLRASTTGIQRYFAEISSRMPEGFIDLKLPPAGMGSAAGLLWEQTLLPLQISHKELLWSPCNTGPLAIKKQVLTVHDIATIEGAETDTRPWRARYYAELFRYLLPRVEGIITVSEFSRQRLLEHFKLDENKVHAIHLGVDHARFKPMPKAEIEAFRQKHKLPEKFVLFLGAVSGRKNVARLLNAWKQAQKGLDEGVELVIAGHAPATMFDGQTLPLLPGRTRLFGRVAEADVAPLLAAASVFAFPSLYEGFGLPPLEAMACGTPCLTSNVTSVPEVVGDAALQINPLDEEALAEGLHKLLTDAPLAKKLSEEGLKRAARFDWTQTASRHLELLRNLS